MRKLNVMSLVFMLALSISYAQNRQTPQLGNFEEVEVEGNIRIFLEHAETSSVVLEAKDEEDFDAYKVSVSGNTLLIRQSERGSGFKSTPKLTVYVKHPGISLLDMDGLVTVTTRDVVRGESLKIKGDGMIRGDMEIIVDRLDIDLDGMCKMTITGRALEADLSVDGMGKIDARGFYSKKIRQSSDGMASIKVGQ
ncbi:MAG: DUF2807 domain-containing protein [Flavobacteriaceae bacterium]